MQKKMLRVLSVALCLLMVLALLPLASAETRRNDARRPNNAGDTAFPTHAEQNGSDDAEEKFTPQFVGEKTGKKDDTRKITDRGTDSALNGKPADADKPNGNCAVTEPDVKKSEEKAAEPTEAEARSNIYSGTLNMGTNVVSVDAGDRMYLSFTPAESGTYRFYTVCDQDTIGYLQNSSKEDITSNDDGGYSNNFMITYDLNSGTSYYLGVGYWSSSNSGTLIVFAERIVHGGSVSQGRVYADIDTAGDTVYFSFTPSASGTYRITSVTGDDTFCWLANDSVRVYTTDDDAGYNLNFELYCELTADQTYYIGMRYLNPSVSGSISALIERPQTASNSYRLSLNWIEITEPGTTMYQTFTAPKTGYYWFYSAMEYQSMTSSDTFCTIADNNNKIMMMDDDSGYGLCFFTSLYLEADTVINIGVRYFSPDRTGYIPLMIEYPYVYQDSMLTLGNNTFSITDGGNSVYAVFTPSESGTYRVYSDSSYDTLGMLMTYSDWEVILFDDDSGTSNNFYYEYEMEAGTSYFIGTRFYGVNSTGDITVVIENTTVPFDGTVVWNRNDVQFKGSTPYVIADGNAKTPRFTVKDAGGHVVNASNYTYVYRENVNAGTGYVIVTMTGGGYQGTLRGWFKIYLPPTTTTYVENVSDGIYVSWAPVEGAAGYVIYRRAWSTTTNGWTAFSRWDNTTATSYLDGHDDSHKVYAGTRYQYGVKAYFEQRYDAVTGALIGGNVGDNYNLGEVGPLKTTVRITTRDLTKIVAGSRKITAYWSPSKNFTGYQLQSATNEAFTQNAKTIKITDPKTSSKAITSLTNGTLYYIRIRSYQEFEGMTYYGGWSNVLSVRPGSGQTVTPPKAKYRAVCVGENAYTDANPLNGCVNDANSMAGMLTGLKNKFTVNKFENAQSGQIISAIRNKFKDAVDSDVSLFSFSGHGNSSGIYAVDGVTITFSQLASELNKIKGRVIVILDCCQSGASIGRGEAFDLDAFNKAAIEAFSGYMLESEAGTRSGELAQSKFIVITAARSSEYSYDGGFDGSGYPQGAFTAALIQGMGCSFPNGAYGGSMPADANNNRSVTLQELYEYICTTVNNWGVPQSAQMYGPGYEVLFAR